MKYYFLIICMCINVWASAQLKGLVYHDSNSNGKHDAEEDVISGIVVSDGYHVVKTDGDGKFEFPDSEKPRFVTIYPNAEYNCTIRFQAVSSENTNYDFALLKKESKHTASFVQISDTETFEQRDWVDNIKKYTRVHQPDFIIHTGDICYETGMLWHSKNFMTEHLGVPVYYCLGNHDLIAGDYGEAFFEKCFGPAWYAFEEGNTLFVVTPMMGGDYKPGFTREEIGGWLENLLSAYPKDQPKVFFNHDLLTNGDEFKFNINKKESINLNDYNLKAWLYGHWHTNMTKDHGNGIVSYGTSTAVMGGIDHSPSGYRVINVSADGKPDSFFKWTYLNRLLEIVSPQKELAVGDDNLIHVSVNTYDSGSAIDSVKCGIWGEVGLNWKTSLETGNWYHLSKNSDWNWSVNIPASDQKHYELLVYAYLKSGEILHQKKQFSSSNVKVKDEDNALWANLAGNKEHDAVLPQLHELPYRLLWVANTKGNIYMSSPVIKDGNVMVASFDDGNASNNHVVCFDTSTGKEKWRYQTRNSIKNQMVVANNLVIATDMLGWTYAIDCNSGTLVWEKSLEHNRLPGIINGNVSDGEVVYAGFAASLSALEAATGKMIWQNKDWDGGDGTTPTMTIAKDKLIVSRQWGGIYAHDRKNGKIVWKRSDDGLRFRDGVLAFKDESLWVAGRGTTDFGLGNLFRLDLETGETQQKFQTNMQNTGTSAPIVLDDQVIAAGSHPGIASFDRSNGRHNWQFDVGEALLYTPSYFADRQQSIETTPVLVGDKLVFGAMDGCLYVLDHESGKQLWKAKLGAPILTSVAVSKTRLYVCDFAGNVYCYTSKTE